MNMSTYDPYLEKNECSNNTNNVDLEDTHSTHNKARCIEPLLFTESYECSESIFNDVSLSISPKSDVISLKISKYIQPQE